MPATQGETFRLLQPGLMSTDELKGLISQRCINIKSIDNLTKQQLVELYERTLMPLSQRKFPNSHRGQLLNKKIAEEKKKQARNEPKSSNAFQYGFEEKSSRSSSKRHISFESTSSGSSDRLKPPIDSSASSPKKICLRRPSSDKDLEKILINDRSKKNLGSSNEGSQREHLQKADKQGSDKRSLVKSHSSTHKESKEKNKEEPSPKRKKIAWP